MWHTVFVSAVLLGDISKSNNEFRNTACKIFVEIGSPPPLAILFLLCRQLYEGYCRTFPYKKCTGALIGRQRVSTWNLHREREEICFRSVMFQNVSLKILFLIIRICCERRLGPFVGFYSKVFPVSFTVSGVNCPSSKSPFPSCCLAICYMRQSRYRPGVAERVPGS